MDGMNMDKELFDMICSVESQGFTVLTDDEYYELLNPEEEK